MARKNTDEDSGSGSEKNEAEVETWREVILFPLFYAVFFGVLSIDGCSKNERNVGNGREYLTFW